MLKISHLDLLKVESDSLEVQGCTSKPAGPIGCFILMVRQHKDKVGHLDLIII